VTGYRERPAPPSLRVEVECGWRAGVPAGAAPTSGSVLPDGCMDLIWIDGHVVVAGPDTAAHPVHRSGAGGGAARPAPRAAGAACGQGPAPLRRVLRFRVAAALLAAGRPPADVAAHAGYADQPHLSREIRDLAGVTAASLRP